MHNAEQENKYDSGDATQNSAAGDLLRDAALAIGGNDLAIARRSFQLDSSQLSVSNDEQVREMASRLLLSGAAGYTTRLGCFMSGLSRIPKVGPVATLATPFIVSGITSSYMKTGEFTDSRSLIEGAASYGLLGQGFKLASQDAAQFATQVLARKYMLRTNPCMSVELQSMQCGVPINNKLREAIPAAATPRPEARKAATKDLVNQLDIAEKLRLKKK
ncbi:MAG: hypothetical protein K2W95_29260 [Candidatus Obscuribacterales bacterium]|nr:hypothetical protein [Candidatus Obscuribacterales bacterium]